MDAGGKRLRGPMPGLLRPRYTKVQAGPAFLISHDTARWIWAYLRAFDDPCLRDYLDDLYPDDMLHALDADSVAEDTSLRPVVQPRVTSLRIEEISRAVRSPGPFDVLVGATRNRRSSNGIRCHLWRGPIPDGLLVPLSRDVYLCAPELVFLQLADSLSPVELQLYAYEICGSYTYVADGPLASETSLHDDVRAITTPDRLRDVVALASHLRGLDVSRFVVRHVHAGSRSPMESQLAMLLDYPLGLGGFACGPMVMDYRIDLSPQAQLIAAREFLVADIFVPSAMTDVEYQGGHHGRSAQRSRDDARTNALLFDGVIEHRVWRENLYDERFLEGIARMIHRRSGVKTRAPSRKGALRRASLLRELEDITRASGSC